MTTRLQRYVLALLRIVSLLTLAGLGTVFLVRCAPGYFTRTDELSTEHSQQAREKITAQRVQEGSPIQVWWKFSRGLLQGDFGRSLQYNVPVRTMLLSRLRVTGLLLFCTTLPAPLLALMFALPCSQMLSPSLERTVAFATLLGIAVPVGVLASMCLVSGRGGPAAVLLTLLTARDFRYFTRLLRRQSKAPYLLYARACGVQPLRGVLQAVLRPTRNELASLVALSMITALSAVIPVEVIFGVPGLGQMAWNAAMNRDLPVLLVVTLLMASCVGLVGLFQQSVRQSGEALA